MSENLVKIQFKFDSIKFKQCLRMDICVWIGWIVGYYFVILQ